MQYREADYAADEWDIYWYEKNLQGDIVAVYNEAGVKLLTYTYNAWGEITNTSYYSNGGSTTVDRNPFRYRGYYYDKDLGMYYLQTRYYDAEICRFINADGYISTGQGLIGYNMYAYCNNNPVNCVDSSGTIPGMVMMQLYEGSSIKSIADRVNINGNNPNGDIKISITQTNGKINVKIYDSYRFIDRNIQKQILQIIFQNEDYIKYGGLGESLLQMILIEWNGHNLMYWGTELREDFDAMVRSDFAIKYIFKSDPKPRAKDLDFGNEKDRYHYFYSLFY